MYPVFLNPFIEQDNNYDDVPFCVAALIAGYFIYGAFVEKVFGIKENRTTPAYSKQDGVDYVPMSNKKVYLVQLLNIAGVGPIFGPIMGPFTAQRRCFGLF